MPRRFSVKEPKILEMPAQKMAVVQSEGEPNKAGAEVLPALYGSVYKLRADLKKRGVEFKIEPLRARWPNAHLVHRDQWIAIWGLPIPRNVASLPQKTVNIEVRIEEWKYGTIAQILHVGPFSTELDSVDKLHEFIAENGYEIAGTHEEEYLTTLKAKVQKTIIRYPIRKKVKI